MFNAKQNGLLNTRTGYAFLMPGGIVIAAVIAAPLLYAIYLSFQHYILIYGLGGWYSLNNYIDAFRNGLFNSSWVTLKLTVYCVIIEFFVAFGLALLLNQKKLAFRNFYLTILLIPIFITPVSVALMFRLIFDPTVGIANWLVGLVGIPPQGWFGNPHMALGTLVFVDAWHETSLLLLILFVGLKSLPKGPIEAALIDGANPIQILAHVTWPLMKPIIQVAILIRMITALRSYDLIYVLTQGGPGDKTEVISFFTYLLAFRSFNIGQATAVAFMLLIVVFIATVVLLKVMNDR